MTEKRFGMYQNTLYDDGDILNPFNAMKLLNYFDKENTKLKEENKQLKQQLSNVQTLYKSTDDNLFACRKTNNELRECYSKLEKENEQLKQEKDYFEKKKCDYWNKYNQAYLNSINFKKENEQLKQENRKLKEDLEHCANQFTNDGKNVLLSLR